MKKKLFLIIICLFVLLCVACHVDYSFGDTYEKKKTSKYTGNTILMDSRIFLVGDIINMCFQNDIPSDTIKQNEKGQAKLDICVRNAYIHKRFYRHIMATPCLFTLTQPEMIKADTLNITFRPPKKNELLRIDKKKCLIGINKSYYLEKKGSLANNFWEKTEASLISPYLMYSLDSLVSYDSVYNMWRNECSYR
jgi:hypothetical protein